MFYPTSLSPKQLFIFYNLTDFYSQTSNAPRLTGEIFAVTTNRTCVYADFSNISKLVFCLFPPELLLFAPITQCNEEEAYGWR